MHSKLVSNLKSQSVSWSCVSINITQYVRGDNSSLFQSSCFIYLSMCVCESFTVLHIRSQNPCAVSWCSTSSQMSRTDICHPNVCIMCQWTSFGVLFSHNRTLWSIQNSILQNLTHSINMLQATIWNKIETICKRLIGTWQYNRRIFSATGIK